MTFDFNDDDPLHIETLAIRAGQSAGSINEGVKLAEQSIDSGAALKKLEELAARTNR